VVAVDIIALIDALKIEQPILAGFDWGRADCQHHCGTLAGPLQGHGLGERLSDRQTGTSPRCRCRREPNGPGGISIIFATEKWPSRLRQETGTILPSSSGRSLRQKWQFDDATFEPVRPRPSTIRTMSPW